MTLEEKIKFLKDTIEPIYDQTFGNTYRASAYLTDGTYIPCVRFRNPELRTELAIKRFDEERTGKSIFKSNSGNSYKDIVELFVTSGNLLNDNDIDRIDISPFAFPKAILSQIKGETSMSWTGFCAKMNDGNIFGFGTSYRFDFFEMPKGYHSNNITEIMNHSYIAKDGTIKEHQRGWSSQREDYVVSVIHREKPFFDCYIKGL